MSCPNCGRPPATEADWEGLRGGFRMSGILICWGGGNCQQHQRLSKIKPMPPAMRDQLTESLGLGGLARVPWRADAPGSAAVIEAAVLDTFQHVRGCTVETDGPQRAICWVRPRWYCYLALGLWHLWLWWKAGELVEVVRPMGVSVRVRVL